MTYLTAIVGQAVCSARLGRTAAVRIIILPQLPWSLSCPEYEAAGAGQFGHRTRRPIRPDGNTPVLRRGEIAACSSVRLIDQRGVPNLRMNSAALTLSCIFVRVCDHRAPSQSGFRRLPPAWPERG